MWTLLLPYHFLTFIICHDDSAEKDALARTLFQTVLAHQTSQEIQNSLRAGLLNPQERSSVTKDGRSLL